jgi:sugar phosphate isomerase/epimerase
MRTIKGPAIFVAQYVSDEAPFNSLENIAKWAKSTGFKGIQLPIDPRLIDISKASTDENYCKDLLKSLTEIGVELTE